MAGDDTVMTIVALGAIIALVPLALTKLDREQSWKDSVRLALLGTWIVAIINSVVLGFYIEFHEDVFGAAMSANHDVLRMLTRCLAYSRSPLLRWFSWLLTTTSSSLLRRVTGWMASVGLIIATIGSSLWTFLDPSVGGFPYWSYILGILILGVSGLAATLGIYKASVKRVSRTEV